MSISKKMFQLKLTYKNKTFGFKISLCGRVKIFFVAVQNIFFSIALIFMKPELPTITTGKQLLNMKQLDHFSTWHYCLNPGPRAAGLVSAAMQT